REQATKHLLAWRQPQPRYAARSRGGTVAHITCVVDGASRGGFPTRTVRRRLRSAEPSDCHFRSRPDGCTTNVEVHTAIGRGGGYDDHDVRLAVPFVSLARARVRQGCGRSRGPEQRPGSRDGTRRT